MIRNLFKPIEYKPILREYTTPIIIEHIPINTSHVTRKEVDLLCSYSKKLLKLLKGNSLTMKDFDLFFTVLQHTFYLEQITTDTQYGNIRKIILDITEKKVLPLLIDEGDRFTPNPQTTHNKIKVEAKRRDSLVMFCELYVKELEQELLHRKIITSRQRYAEILSNGMENYRLYIAMLPDMWGKLIDHKDFKETHKVFNAHLNLQKEAKK